jgi:hypothetical protein
MMSTMRFMRNLSWNIKGFIACFALAYTSIPVLAQEADLMDRIGGVHSTVSESTRRDGRIDTEAIDPFVLSVMDRSWESDKALDVKVTFQVQRKPLGQFLESLRLQTGIKFELAPGGGLHQKQLTARGTEMSLAQVMSSLARLYGMTWTKQDAGGYSGGGLALNGLERSLLSFGEVDAWRDPRYSMSGGARAELASAAMKFANRELLNSETGQPLKELPEELQRAIKGSLAEQSAWELVGSFSRASLLNLSEVYIRMERAPHAISKIKKPLPLSRPQAAADLLEVPFSLSLIDSRQRPILPITNIHVNAADLPAVGDPVERN